MARTSLERRHMSLIANGKFPDLFCGNSLANRLDCRTYPRGNERAETGKSQTFAVFCYLAVETRSRQTASTATQLIELRVLRRLRTSRNCADLSAAHRPRPHSRADPIIETPPFRAPRAQGLRIGSPSSCYSARQHASLHGRTDRAVRVRCSGAGPARYGSFRETKPAPL